MIARPLLCHVTLPLAGSWLGASFECILRSELGVRYSLPKVSAKFALRSLDLTQTRATETYSILNGEKKTVLLLLWKNIQFRSFIANQRVILSSQASWLRHATAATSFCTGAGTAEMSRAYMQKSLNDSGMLPFEVDISTVAMWDPCYEYCAMFSFLFCHLSIMSCHMLHYAGIDDLYTVICHFYRSTAFRPCNCGFSLFSLFQLC